MVYGTVVSAMREHPADAELQGEACWAVAALAQAEGDADVRAPARAMLLAAGPIRAASAVAGVAAEAAADAAEEEEDRLLARFQTPGLGQATVPLRSPAATRRAMNTPSEDPCAVAARGDGSIGGRGACGTTCDFRGGGFIVSRP